MYFCINSKAVIRWQVSGVEQRLKLTTTKTTAETETDTSCVVTDRIEQRTNNQFSAGCELLYVSLYESDDTIVCILDIIITYLEHTQLI